MLDKLKQVEQRYTEIEAKLAEPAYYADPAVSRALFREQSRLRPIIDAYRAWLQTETDIAETRALLEDPELRDMAAEELRAYSERRRTLEQELRVLLLPRDPNDDKNVILEIRSGVGGEESALFAHSLYRMYSMYADRHGWKTEVANLSETELGGIREISVIITGEGA